MRLVNVPALNSNVGIETVVNGDYVTLQTTEGYRVDEFCATWNPEILGRYVATVILDAQRIGYENAQRDMRKSMGIQT